VTQQRVVIVTTRTGRVSDTTRVVIVTTRTGRVSNTTKCSGTKGSAINMQHNKGL